jgi:hypothetical protein
VDQEIKTRWVEALRSGRYQQVTGKLRTEEGYCCLGVLCVAAELSISSDGFHVEEDYEDEDYDEDGYAPLNALVGGKSIVKALYGLNDDERKTFPEIADYIEANL